MKLIRTRWLARTATKPPRIRASSDRSSFIDVTVGELNREFNDTAGDDKQMMNYAARKFLNHMDWDGHMRITGFGRYNEDGFHTLEDVRRTYT